MLQRDFKVIDDKFQLAPYELDQTFTVKITKGEQVKLPGV